MGEALRMKTGTITKAMIASPSPHAHHPGGTPDHPGGESNRRTGGLSPVIFDRAAGRSSLFSELSR
ncbi:hypothetical protein ASG25_16640 [Rhizobium sp. Leaf384]|nr:hypothetical protein ASG25_16640 [Rhizobium sp. Leaf384]KQS78285.1 hypothetical protein ASG58_07855 [Rhizobium sp. Leaf383]